MAVYTPATTIKLCNVPFSADYKHVIKFSDAAAQSSYFEGKSVKSYSNFDYLAKERIILVPDHVDSLAICNYVMYRNANYTNKWFYAFIEKMEFRSNGSTAITIKTDVFQTWFLSATMNRCFVEREHVLDDTIGLHLIDEGLETGEYIFRGSTDYQRAFMGSMGLIAAVSEYKSGESWVTAAGNVYNGVFSGVILFESNSPGNMSAFLSEYIEDGKADSVIALYMIPQTALSSWHSVVTAVSDSTSCVTFDVTVPAISANIDGYVPKNNKLFSFPYTYFQVFNNAGSMAAFRYENFDGQPVFSVYGGVTPPAVYKCFPKNLKNSNGAGNGLEYGLTISDYPVCCFAIDTFKNWFGQNAGLLAASAASGVLQITSGAISGNPFMITGGVGEISGILKQLYQKSIAPDQVQGSLNSGSANNAKGWNDFYFTPKYIKAEFAEIIDNYFTMFGYRCNLVKVPNMTNRPYFNYCKTVDCNLSGPIPQDDLIELRKIFDNGVTLWHQPSSIYDYTVDNSPVEV